MFLEDLPGVLILHVLAFATTHALAALSSTSQGWQDRIRAEWVRLSSSRFPHELLPISIPPHALWFCAKGRAGDDARVAELLRCLCKFQSRWPNAWTFADGIDNRLTRLSAALGAVRLPADVALMFVIGGKFSGASPIQDAGEDEEAASFAFTASWSVPERPAQLPGLPEIRTLRDDLATEIYPDTAHAVHDNLSRHGISVEQRNDFIQVAHTFQHAIVDCTIFVEASGCGALHMLHVSECGNCCTNVGFNRPTLDTQPVTFTWLVKRILNHLGRPEDHQEAAAEQGAEPLEVMSVHLARAPLWMTIMEQSAFDAPGIEYDNTPD